MSLTQGPHSRGGTLKSLRLGVWRPSFLPAAEPWEGGQGRVGSWMGAPLGLLAAESLGEGTTPGEAAGGSHGEMVPRGPP